MSSASVQSSVMGQVDRLARWRLACQDVVSIGGGTLWDRVDASEDVDYENAVEGVVLAAVDSAIAALDAGGSIAGFFTKHNEYFSGQGLSGFAAYLASRRFRAHEDFGDLYYDRFSSRIAASNLFPRQNRTLASWIQDTGSDVFSPGTGIPSQTVGPCIVEALVDAIDSPGAVLSVTLPTQAGSPNVVLPLTLTSAGAGSVFALGAQDVVSDVSVGDGTLGVDSTGQFTANDVVIVTEGGKTELVTVYSITADSYLETTSPMVNSFTTGADIYPLFFDVISAAAASGCSDDDEITFRPRLDRTPAW